MAKLMEIEKSVPFGGKGGAGVKKNTRQYADSYGVKAITDLETLEQLAELSVYNEKGEKHMVLDFDESDWEKFGYKGNTMGGAMQMFNRIFDTLEIPFVAQTAVAKGTEATTRVLKQGKNMGEEKTAKVANRVRVSRYAEEFDPMKYATTRAAEAGRVNVAHPGEPSPTHEDSPEGLVKCLEEWALKAADDLDYKLIEAIGLLPKMEELGVEFEESDEKSGEE